MWNFSYIYLRNHYENYVTLLESKTNNICKQQYQYCNIELHPHRSTKFTKCPFLIVTVYNNIPIFENNNCFTYVIFISSKRYSWIN